MPTVYDRSKHDRPNYDGPNYDRPQYDRPQLDDPLADERPQELTGEAVPSPPQQLHQKHLMLSALGLLFLALLVVTGRNWDFWSQYLFPQTAETESPASDAASTRTPAVATNKTATATIVRKPRSAPKPAAATPDASQQAPAVTTQRTVLPPLEIEVVSGGQHSKLQPKTNALHVELDSGSQPQPSAAQTSGAVTQAAQRAPITSGDQVVSHEVAPSYPYLAKQQKVQGSVLLRALVSKSGDIQNLQVLTGPTMLAEAARDAVKQWRFKPYYQDGQAVETEAQIRVNFTISAY